MLRVPFAPVAQPAGKDPRRWIAIGFAGAVNLALLYGLGSGLAIRFVEQLPSVLEVNVVEKQPRVANPTLPQPPAPEFAAPQSIPQIPVPKIVIAHAPPAPHAITAVAVEKPVATPQRVAPSTLTPVKAAPVIAPTSARGIEGTHTTPPYPPVALRLGEEGTVRLHIALDSTGRIESVRVAKTSGSERLDNAAVNWVAKHWRYAPATRDGKPVASSVLADVRFDLQYAR
ncbi:MAG: energy transducer TonB [Proteobacteria bacterium]|nr:energy transducer TonB [Pseudomonadota bacterium]